jgi:hypothetical protein
MENVAGAEPTRRWIVGVTGLQFSHASLRESLASGVLLCLCVPVFFNWTRYFNLFVVCLFLFCRFKT